MINKRGIVNDRVREYHLVRTYLHQNFDIVNYRGEIYIHVCEIDCFLVENRSVTSRNRNSLKSMELMT